MLGGISKQGATPLQIFKGKLDGPGFHRLCDRFLIPFIRRKYPFFHRHAIAVAEITPLCYKINDLRLHMDNAPCHKSRRTQVYLQMNNIHHFLTPPQSPDLNPIELVWHDMKVFISNEVKPETEAELVAGIQRFWKEKVNKEYCSSKINHIFKVLRVIEKNNGLASGL